MVGQAHRHSKTTRVRERLASSRCMFGTLPRLFNVLHVLSLCVCVCVCVGKLLHHSGCPLREAVSRVVPSSKSKKFKSVGAQWHLAIVYWIWDALLEGRGMCCFLWVGLRSVGSASFIHPCSFIHAPSSIHSCISFIFFIFFNFIFFKSWTLFASSTVGRNGQVVGVDRDLQKMTPLLYAEEIDGSAHQHKNVRMFSWVITVSVSHNHTANTLFNISF